MSTEDTETTQKKPSDAAPEADSAGPSEEQSANESETEGIASVQDSDPAAIGNAEAPPDDDAEGASDEDPDASEASAEAPASETEPEVVARGPKPGWKAWLITLLSGLIVFLLMADEHRLRVGVPLGLLASVVTCMGLLYLLRTFEPRLNPGPCTEAGSLKRPLLRLLGSSTAHIASIMLAVAGALPLEEVSAALLITGTFLWTLVELWSVLSALGVWKHLGKQDKVWNHYGFWLLAISTLLYLPMLGNFSLIDPWETHYGEVAREILARDDWISLWWAQDGWFWSKPIFDFWMQALSFKIFGVHYMPDQMLLGYTKGLLPQPEWACRLPVFWMTIGAAYAIYKAISPGLGKRAAFVGGLILTASPYWFLIARQTMTDMPYVAALTAAMACLLLGFQTDPNARPTSFALKLFGKQWHVSGFHLLFTAILLCALPQVLYLISRNVTLHWGFSFEHGFSGADPTGFRIHLDEFQRGSGGGNCGEPGNKTCRPEEPLYAWAQPVWAGLIWLLMAAVLVLWNRKERRLQRLYFIAAWFFTSLAVMAKGAPGIVIPLATALVYPGVTGRLRDYLRLELPALILLLLCVALPWYAQMYARHGFPFIERLVLHDMVKRAFQHVHDTNKGDDLSFRYYIWQLGYGLFPWTGFAAAGIFWTARRGEEPDSPKAQTRLFMMIWLMVAFGMFTITLTKFHHYVLPLIPPVAALGGSVVACYLPESLKGSLQARASYVGGLLLGSVLTLYGLLRLFPGRLSGAHFPDEDLTTSPALGITCLVLGMIALALCMKRFGMVLGGAAIAPTSDSQHNADDTEQTLSADASASEADITSDATHTSETEHVESTEANADASIDKGDASPQPSTRKNLTLSTPQEASTNWDSAVLGVIAVFSTIAVIIAGIDLAITVKGDLEGQARLLHLFTYNYDRKWPAALDFKGSLAAFALFFAGAGLLLTVPKVRKHAGMLFCTGALLWTAWCVDIYLVAASPHWGQRETMLAYYANRKDASEPLIAYQMNWKGENFYTGNKMATFVSSGKKFKRWLKKERRKGVHTMFVTTEHSRIKNLKRELEDHTAFTLLTDEQLNNKFFLAKVEFGDPPPPEKKSAKTKSPRKTAARTSGTTNRQPVRARPSPKYRPELKPAASSRGTSKPTPPGSTTGPSSSARAPAP